jgi:hypothetical protein
MLIALLVLGTSLLLLVGLAAVRWWAARRLEDVLTDAHEDARPQLPEGHRPPPGLGPISPSERTLAAEVERGLRDLQAYLLDAA